jgi:hypothetical protein
MLVTEQRDGSALPAAEAMAVMHVTYLSWLPLVALPAISIAIPLVMATQYGGVCRVKGGVTLYLTWRAKEGVISVYL